MKHVVLMSVLLLACGTDAPPVRIEAQGFAFAVPSGFAHEVQVRSGQDVHLLRKGASAIGLTGVTIPKPLRCRYPFPTAAGLVGCMEDASVDAGSLALALVQSQGFAVVILATERGPDARELVRSVTEAVEITARNGTLAAAASGSSVQPSHQVDLRFFGCFSHDPDFLDVSTAPELCLGSDRSFQWHSMIRGASRDPFTNEETFVTYGEERDHGTWRVEQGPSGQDAWNLRLSFSDGTEALWPVRFDGTTLVRGNDEFWPREAR